MKNLKKSEKEIWNELYKEGSKLYPLQDFIFMLIDVFRKSNIQTILDLACGLGKSLIHLLKLDLTCLD